MAKEVPEKYASYVVTDLPKYIDVPGHHHPTPFYLLLVFRRMSNVVYLRMILPLACLRAIWFPQERAGL